MFERYTEHARRIIFFARYEASQLGDNYITPEHMLLGYFRENFPALTTLLDAAAINAISEEIRAKRTNPKIATSVDMPLSNAGKRVLAYAAEEAERQSNPHIGSEHLFLGILREKNCEAAQLLERFGLTIESARQWAHTAKQAEDERKDIENANPEWVSLGLPVGYAWPRLIFNPITATLILEMSSKGRVMPPSRLFVRHKDAAQYRPLAVEDRDVSCDSAVTAATQPIVAFNTHHCPKNPHRPGSMNYDWRAVELFDLASLSRVRSIARPDLALSHPYQDGWVSALLALSADSNVLHLKLALIAAPREGAHYYLASLDLRTMKIDLISQLTGAFC